MKGKIIFPIILSAMLLTACREQPSEVQTEQAETTSQTVTAASETEIEVPETITTAVTTSETAAETTTTAVETQPPKIENIGENVTLDLQKIDLNDIIKKDVNVNRLFFIGDTAAVGPLNGDLEIYFLDLDSKTIKGKISPPDDWKLEWIYTYIEGSGDVLCKLEVYKYDAEINDYKHGTLVVYNDFSTEIIEDEPEKNLAIPVGSHNISDVTYNIYDADSGEILVEGFNDAENYGISSKWFDYKFPIDNDRFVYRTAGYESLPGFGYYDFAAGKAVDFPDSEDFIPVGCHNGKIYAEASAWDGVCGGEMYTFDIKTLEAEHFMSSPAELGQYDYTEYYMPPSGEYIVASHHDEDNENYKNSKNIIFILSPDSGEVLAKCEFYNKFYPYSFEFMDGGKFAAYSSETNEIVIFDLKM